MAHPKWTLSLAIFSIVSALLLHVQTAFNTLQPEIVVVGPNSGNWIGAVREQHNGVRGGDGHQRLITVANSPIPGSHYGRSSRHCGGRSPPMPPLLAHFPAQVRHLFS
ncbi:hypothetical protein SAY87_031103 [Trapa incisa]|uniref:Uncharacterized protein n=1 Tax=Trapa incisa TaxID=236973 RepID=A0AAN7KWF3_9MYRT|nr:hypothetical protein SAY87_031103 [Trapa incisa]